MLTSARSIEDSCEAFMGGAFVNYFNRFGNGNGRFTWRPRVRPGQKAENVGQFQVRNSQGGMVPLSAVTQIQNQSGPEYTMPLQPRYRAVQINGNAAPGYSSTDAMKALEEVFAQSMPPEMGFDYLGMSFQEKLAQKGVPIEVIFGISLLFVFLVLAAMI